MLIYLSALLSGLLSAIHLSACLIDTFYTHLISMLEKARSEIDSKEMQSEINMDMEYLP